MAVYSVLLSIFSSSNSVPGSMEIGPLAVALLCLLSKLYTPRTQVKNLQ